MGISGGDFMNHLDNNWTENSFWDQWRMALIFGFVLLAMAVIGTIFVGADGILRMFGLLDDAYKARLSIAVEPADAMVQLDFTTVEHPVSQTVEWDRSTEHVIEVQHPAFRPEKIVISVPESPASLPVSHSHSEASRVEISPDVIDVRIALVPEYIPIRVESRPDGALVTVNGIETGKTTPLTHEFVTGETAHLIVSRKGYMTREVDYNVPDHVPDQPLVFELEKKPEPREPRGRLAVKSEFPVDVYSGKRRIIARRKSATAVLKPGRHRIRLVNDDFLLDETRDVQIKDGHTHTIALEPPGTMILETEPPGAEVAVGNIRLGTTPGTFIVAPGLYNVVFKWEQCDDAESRWVKVVAEQTRRVRRVNGCR